MSRRRLEPHPDISASLCDFRQVAFLLWALATLFEEKDPPFSMVLDETSCNFLLWGMF